MIYNFSLKTIQTFTLKPFSTNAKVPGECAVNSVCQSLPGTAGHYSVKQCFWGPGNNNAF